MTMIMADNNPWEQIIVLLHSNNDLPDSDILNGMNFLTISNKNNYAHKIEIRKKISVRESTRKIPCTKYEKRTCENIEDNIVVFHKFHCQTPILYQGKI